MCMEIFHDTECGATNSDAIYHMHAETLAGLPIKGWAIPPIMPNFRLAYYIQLLRRYDEAIALDFIVPFRILFPDQGGPQGQDPLQTMNMNNFINHIGWLFMGGRMRGFKTPTLVNRHIHHNCAA